MAWLKGNIVKILSEYSVVINLGEKQGVKKRDRFIIYELSDPIFDLDGTELEPLELVKGQVEITHVQATISIGESFTVEKKSYTPMGTAIDLFRTVEYTEKVTQKLAEGPKSPPKPSQIKVGDLVRQVYQAT